MSSERLRHIAVWAVLASVAFLTSCTSIRYAHTTGPIAAGEVKPSTFSIRYATAIGNTMSIRHRTMYNAKPQLTPKQEADLWAEARQLREMLDRGLKQRFSEHAKKYKLTLVPESNAPGDMPKLGILIAGVEGDCSVNCSASLNVVAVAGGPNLPLWRYSSRVGPTMAIPSIDDTLFDAFARHLLDAMVKDGVVEKP